MRISRKEWGLLPGETDWHCISWWNVCLASKLASLPHGLFQQKRTQWEIVGRVERACIFTIWCGKDELRHISRNVSWLRPACLLMWAACLWPSKIHMLVMVFEFGDEIRFRRCHEGWGPIMGFMSFCKKRKRHKVSLSVCLSLSLCTCIKKKVMWGHKQKKGPQLEPNNASTPVSYLQPPVLWEVNVC